MDTDHHTDEEIKKFYNLKNIAVVGMSKNEEILERKSYNQVSEIKEDVDIVDIFRKSEDIVPVVEDLLKKKGIKVIWLQKGIFNQRAEEMAKTNGIDFVYNRCMLEEHQRLFTDRNSN